jgi:hypothetical protein
MSLNEKKIKNASLKYVNIMDTSDACGIDVIFDGVAYAVPLDLNNVDYALIKELLDAGEITIEEADN